MFIKDIVIGDIVKDAIFILEQLNKGEDGYHAILSDKTGRMEAVISNERYEEQFSSYVTGAVKITGAVLNGNNGEVCVKIKSMEIAEKGAFKPSDLFDGLTEEKSAQYMDAIRDAIHRIPDASCKALCEAVLTEDVLTLMSQYPASIAYQARFRGGALAQTATVTRMVLQTAFSYQKCHNGLYGGQIEWSVLLSGALLHMTAILDFIEEQPWRRKAIGIDRGYMSLLQSRIEKTVLEQQIPISEEKLARLLNVLQVAQYRSTVKASTPEGVLLRQLVMTFTELDLLYAAVAEEASGKAQFYDPKSRRLINTVPVEAGTAEEAA